MSELRVGDAVAVSVKLYVPNQGPWFADVAFEDDAPSVVGRVTLKIGTLALSGTVDPATNGVYGLQRRCRIIAGADGWGRTVAAKHYHNDAGVKSLTVAQDAARAVGETISGFAPAAARLGADYVRNAGLAVRALEDAAGGAAWWIDNFGLTHVGNRVTVPTDPARYEVEHFDPKTRIATLAVDGADAIVIGSALTEVDDGVSANPVVRDLEIEASSDGRLRVRAWCGGDAAARSRLADALVSIARRATDQQLLGKWRYRVISMSGDRVNLQAVRKAAGLPDALNISMWPGVAGAHAELPQGAEVLVEFIEGDRKLPIITHFAGKDGKGHVPIELSLCGGTRPAAHIGSTVTVFFPPEVPIAGTLGGSPFTGVITILTPSIGIVETGATKVKV